LASRLQYTLAAAFPRLGVPGLVYSLLSCAMYSASLSRACVSISLLCIAAVPCKPQQSDAARDLKYEREQGLSTAKRRALVIGNDAYQSFIPLQNAVNDAQAFEAALKELHFEVTALHNATLAQFGEGILKFADTVHKGDVVVVYYAGHGVQIDGENYFIPVDFTGNSQGLVKFGGTIRALDLTKRIDDSGAALRIYIFDACRTNPFRGTRSVAGGLAYMDSAKGSYIAFAAAPGQAANETADRNGYGVFTKHLLEALKEPGITLDEVFTTVRLNVDRETKGAQLPYSVNGTLGQFQFKPGARRPTAEQIQLEARLKQTEADAARAEDELKKTLALKAENDRALKRAAEDMEALKGENERVKRDKAELERLRQQDLESLAREKQELERQRGEARHAVESAKTMEARVAESEAARRTSDRIAEQKAAEAERAKAANSGQASDKVAEAERARLAAAQAAKVKDQLEAEYQAELKQAREREAQLAKLDDQYQTKLKAVESQKTELTRAEQRVRDLEAKLAVRAEELDRDRQQLKVGIAEMRQNSVDRQEYVWVPPGEFFMGCVPGDSECQSDEQPRHKVRITNGFWMGRTEATVLAYQRFAASKKLKMPPATQLNPKWRFTDHPITRVAWEDADDFCKWAGGRLPTEAEWEYAARGGLDGQIYPWGASLTRDKANYDGKGDNDRWEETAPVRSFDANSYGLFDMAGNVWEWVADFYDANFYAEPNAKGDDPKGASSGQQHVARGGSWNSAPKHLRVSIRRAGATANNLGFRCVLTNVPK
jgi:sulfatase modifying factor 1